MDIIPLGCLDGCLKLSGEAGGIGIFSTPDIMVIPDKPFVDVLTSHVFPLLKKVAVIIANVKGCVINGRTNMLPICNNQP